MADNTTRKNAAGTSEGVASDRVTYSGDADQILALQRSVHVTGAEGSKTVVDITDANGAFVQGPVAHDAPSAGNPVLMGGRASAAAPSDVSADGDAVRAWLLRNGARAVALTAAGALIGGDATNGLDVDVTRLDSWRIPTDTTMQTAVSATGNGSSLTCTGYGIATLLVTGTFTAVVTVEGTLDGGTTWTALNVSQVGGSDILDTITAAGVYRAVVSGFDSIRARVTWTSGTSVTVVGRATNAAYVARVVRQVGNVAHDGVDTGAPVKVGMRAVAHGSNPTAVAAADRTDWLANRVGVPFTIGGHPNSVTRTARVAAADGAQTGVSISGTVNAGSKFVCTRLSVMASNANTVNVRAKVAFSTSTTLPSDATGGTAGILADHPAIPPGGGFTIGDGSGIIGIGADDEELRWTTDSPTSGHITCSMSGYTIES